MITRFFFFFSLKILPEQLEYWPPLIFAHIETSKNNEELTIGAALVSASHKYLEAIKGICEESSIQVNSIETKDDVEGIILYFIYLNKKNNLILILCRIL